MQMADNAFNYSAMAGAASSCLARFVDPCGCYEFAYGDLDEAAAIFDDLAAEHVSTPPSLPLVTAALRAPQRTCRRTPFRNGRN